MTTLTPDALVIRMKSPDPGELRSWLIDTIAAAIRWRSNWRGQHADDDMHLSTLAELLSELSGREEGEG